MTLFNCTIQFRLLGLLASIPLFAVGVALGMRLMTNFLFEFKTGIDTPGCRVVLLSKLLLLTYKSFAILRSRRLIG